MFSISAYLEVTFHTFKDAYSISDHNVQSDHLGSQGHNVQSNQVIMYRVIIQGHVIIQGLNVQSDNSGS